MTGKLVVALLLTALSSSAAVSAELALRLAAALGGSAESWMQMQAAYDLWHADVEVSGLS